MKCRIAMLPFVAIALALCCVALCDPATETTPNDDSAALELTNLRRLNDKKQEELKDTYEKIVRIQEEIKRNPAASPLLQQRLQKNIAKYTELTNEANNIALQIRRRREFAMRRQNAVVFQELEDFTPKIL